MWELLGISLSWWLVSLSGVMMPGPVSAMAVTEGTRRGPVAGPLLTVGHAGAEAVMLGLLILGMNRALALVVGAGRGKIPATAFRVVLGGCGVFLIGMSLYFVYTGVDFLTR